MLSHLSVGPEDKGPTGAARDHSGGAGGGAILLASSTSVTINGPITASGGVVGLAAGAAGTIRVVAPSVSAAGASMSLGEPPISIRRLPGDCAGSGWKPSRSPPHLASGLELRTSLEVRRLTRMLAPSGVVRVTAVNGIAVPVTPSGSFALPDVTINADTPVNVDIEATGFHLERR